MEKNGNAQANILKATREQTDWLIDARYDYLKEKRNDIVGFVAIDKDEKIIGHLIAEEKEAPMPQSGTDWFIWNIFTLPELRHRGIASALLHEATICAKKLDIQNLIGSCIHTPAQMFWHKHNFCSIIYGQKIDDENNPDTHGNNPHMIFRRADKSGESTRKQKNCRIAKADKEQLDWIFDNHILNDGLKFFHDKKEDIFGFAAFDEENNCIGIITAYSYEMGSPLKGEQWMVPYIYVRPELRHCGIARTLIGQAAKAAQEAGVAQLTCLFVNDDAVEFLRGMNFDICNYYIMSKQDGRCPVSAALRVN